MRLNILHINSYCTDSKFYKHLFVAQKNTGLDLTAYIPVKQGFDTSKMDFGDDALIAQAYKGIDRYFFVSKINSITKDIHLRINVKEYDIMHAHSLFANGGVAYKLHKKYGIPYIVAVRDTDVNFFMKNFFFLRSFGIKILKNASRIIFISPNYRENGLDPYIKNYKNSDIYKKSQVIPNGIDPFWTDNAYHKEEPSDDGIINILCVARIQKRKNLITLADACKKLIDEGTQLKLTIIGKNEDNSVLKILMNYDFINYVSPCNKEELIHYYRENDIFALVSKTETFGLVYLEAISQGLPVVYTAGQGFDGQFMEGYVGYRADSKNICDIANKIVKVYNEKEKIVQNTVACLDDFNWEKIADIYNNIYRECVDKNN